MNLKIYNSLSRRLELFKPINSSKVGMYACGPTVYDYVTIGNWRTYTFVDLVFRTLLYLGFKVKYIMNITDVGHLTGDNLGDPDFGQDRMEKGSQREKKSAWQIADFYTRDFLAGFKKMNLIRPEKFTKATAHLKEQIELIEKIEKKGYVYQINDGIYFDVQKWEKDGYVYGSLSNIDQIKAGARVPENPEKKDSRDFALWKFSPAKAGKKRKRQMEWDSPWGIGFPGWHIECSAMSMKYLGEQFDLHLGGEDLKSTHHPNEIAQSEAATGKKPFVKYWLHGAFLQVDKGRMGKSLGNAYTLRDIEKKGFEPLALRYFYLTGHYRKPLNFTWQALEASQKSLDKLRDLIHNPESDGFGAEGGKKAWQTKFMNAVKNDFNLPEALAIAWSAAKSKINKAEKKSLLLDFDRILGLDLKTKKINRFITAKANIAKNTTDKEIIKMIKEREKSRKAKKWQEADKLRREIEKRGYYLKDTAKGTIIIKKDRGK